MAVSSLVACANEAGPTPTSAANSPAADNNQYEVFNLGEAMCWYRLEIARVVKHQACMMLYAPDPTEPRPNITERIPRI